MGNQIDQHFYRRSHNHKQCVKRAIRKAQWICKQNELRFTDTRKRILELIWTSHEPVLAYDLLKKLRMEKENAEPPTVYRALDFFLAHGLVHKIESMNAYIGCAFPDQPHVSQFLICSDCNGVAELNSDDIGQAITLNAQQLSGFEVSEQTVEIKGICPNCQDNQELL